MANVPRKKPLGSGRPPIKRPSTAQSKPLKPQPGGPKKAPGAPGARPQPSRPSAKQTPKQSSAALPRPGSGVRKPGSGVRKPGSGVRRTASGRRKAASAESIQGDRQALGLSEIKPSEMIKGLDVVAKRAGKAMERAERRRKAGDRMDQNVALHVDDRGRRWARAVKLGLAAAAAAVIVLIAFMVWRTKRKSIDPHQAKAATRDRLANYALYARRIKPFERDEEVSIEALRERLEAYLAGELKKEEAAARQQKASGSLVKKYTLKRIAQLKSDLEFTDGFGKPFVLEMDDEETLVIRTASASKRSKSNAVEIPVPRKPPPPPPKRR